MTDILSPNTEQALSEIILDCKANNQSVRITGGGTRSGLGGAVNATKTLSLKLLSGITLYEPAALTLVAKSGTTYKEIQTTLAAESQRLSFEPMDHRSIYANQGEPTIGGIVAGNISGSRRIQSGACRDAFIGVRYICGHGEIVKNGGRVMKNVTGLDLVKLMAGSYGTLGVMTEVSFKVLPAPERQATLQIANFSVEQAVKAMSKALGSPFEVTGVAHLPNTQDASHTLLRVEGFDSQVTYRLDKLRALLVTNQDVEIIEGSKHDALWQSIRNVDIYTDQTKQLWRLSVKPSDAVKISQQLREKANAELYFDWGGGLIWASMDDQLTNAQSVRQIMTGFGGFATLVRASAATKLKISVFHPQAKGVAKLSALIRQKSDPSGIFNPNLLTSMNLNGDG
ncbi:MAG: 2-hydroxy-acid oxidase [Hyphomicrobiales bacterium]|nr:MAG: 2-hydroxy-acid oxidase [Hyphomicrobiales bacterium]